MTSEPDLRHTIFGRRRFLKRAGIAVAAVPVVGGMVSAACYEDPTGGKATGTTAPQSAATTAAATAMAEHTTVAAATSPAQAADEMDAHHKQGVLDFLKNQETPITKGKGNQPLAFTMDNGVKVFNLTMEEIDWETEPGKVQKARGYNGAIPGPIIRATEGERVRIVVKNNLTESSSVHWHGLMLPNDMDGVPFLTQDPIKPGATYTYEFTLRNSGTHMYHSHHNSMDQVNRGLLGAFIVDPKDASTYPKYDREYILVLNDSLLGFTINGKGFPATDAIFAKKGEKVLIRWLNEGLMNHPMHLHGMPMKVFAHDGWPVPQPYYCDTVDVAPGNRYDVLVDATEVGNWAFHCHILSHAEGTMGMFGLVTAMIVTE